MPKQRRYPGRGGPRSDRDEEEEEEDDRGSRAAGGRRPDPEEHRRRQPRSRSERVAARAAASSSDRPARSREPPPVTRETRRLVPRGTRAPAMTVGNATCFWLHTMGLRDGLSTDTRRALDPSNHANRARALREVRPEDVVVVMTGLLRTMAMLMVELSQLMMLRVESMLPRDDEEVEVEVDDDEEFWMQTSMHKGAKRALEEEEEMACVEQKYKEDLTEERKGKEAQQEEWEQAEAQQAVRDEEQYEQHRAAVYRDWEWWLIQHPPPALPRRLRTVLTVSHGTASEVVACSVPLARGRPVDIQLNLREYVEPTPTGEDNGETGTGVATGEGASGSTCRDHWPGLPGDGLYQQRYEAWGRGELSNHDVTTELGSGMLDMFWAQWLVDTEDIEATEVDEVEQGTHEEVERVRGGEMADESG